MWKSFHCVTKCLTSSAAAVLRSTWYSLTVASSASCSHTLCFQCQTCSESIFWETFINTKATLSWLIPPPLAPPTSLSHTHIHMITAGRFPVTATNKWPFSSFSLCLSVWEAVVSPKTPSDLNISVTACWQNNKLSVCERDEFSGDESPGEVSLFRQVLQAACGATLNGMCPVWAATLVFVPLLQIMTINNKDNKANGKNTHRPSKGTFPHCGINKVNIFFFLSLCERKYLSYLMVSILTRCVCAHTPHQLGLICSLYPPCSSLLPSNTPADVTHACFMVYKWKQTHHKHFPSRRRDSMNRNVTYFDFHQHLIPNRRDQICARKTVRPSGAIWWQFSKQQWDKSKRWFIVLLDFLWNQKLVLITTSWECTK